MGYYFHKYNMLTENVADYLYRLQGTIGIVHLLKLSFEEKYEEINPNRIDLGYKYYFDMDTKELFYEDNYIKVSHKECKTL